MNVLVDVDGVVADLHTAWVEMYNKDYNDNLDPNSIDKWAIHDFVKPECGKKIYDYLKRPDMYDSVPVIEGASEGVKAIRDMGHRVLFLSAGFYPAKVKWLSDHGFTVEYPYHDNRWDTVTDVILAGDKSLIDGEILIDDRIDNVQEFTNPKVIKPGYKQKAAILFTQPWNVNDSWSFRAGSWDTVEKYIPRLDSYLKDIGTL